jgi:hypothetical protein
MIKDKLMAQEELSQKILQILKDIPDDDWLYEWNMVKQEPNHFKRLADYIAEEICKKK